MLRRFPFYSPGGNPLTTPQAPRMKGIPLPEVDDPEPNMFSQASSYAPPPPVKPAVNKPHYQQQQQQQQQQYHRHRHAPPPQAAANQDSGYMTEPDRPSSRHRRGSDAAVHPPSAAAPAPTKTGGLKSILKRRSVQPTPIERTSTTPPPPHAYHNAHHHHHHHLHHPSHASYNSEPRDIPRPVRRIERRDDYALHWQLLPYEPHAGKPRLYFDLMHPATHAQHGDARGWRPISSTDRDKLACKTPVESMTFFVKDLPDFKVDVFQVQAGGVRVGDVLNAIHEAFAVVLTRSDRERLASAVERAKPWFEHRRARARAQGLPEAHGGERMRRFDLLAGRTLFAGVEWIEPCPLHPDGAYTILLDSPMPPPPVWQNAAPHHPSFSGH